MQVFMNYTDLMNSDPVQQRTTDGSTIILNEKKEQFLKWTLNNWNKNEAVSFKADKTTCVDGSQGGITYLVVKWLQWF